MDLVALQAFNLVASHGGFGRASRAANRPKATLSRQVAELEQQLGVRLLERGARALRLTEEGTALQERTAALLHEVVEAGVAVAAGSRTPHGSLRVSAPVVFAHVVLSRLAARFAVAQPQVRLEIVAEDRVVDPVEDGYDIVIRIDPPADDRLVGRRILGDRRLLVAASTVPRPNPTNDPTQALSIPAVLPSAATAAPVWRVDLGAGKVSLVHPQPILRLSSLLMVREAVLAGVGVGLLPRLLVADDVSAGRLISWGVQDGPAVEIWSLQNSRRLTSAKVRAFLDFLAAALPREND